LRGEGTAPKALLLVPVLLLALLMLAYSPAYSPQSGWSLTVQTDRPYYTVGGRVYISGTLTYNGWPQASVQVAVTVKTPSGVTYYAGTSTTDSDGKYKANTTLGGPNAILGQYNVTASASPSDTHLTSWTTFLLIDRIYIKANGDVSPSSAPISRNGDTYRLTGNITGNLVDGIDIQRNNVVLDGAGFTVNVTSQIGSYGIYMNGVSNVTIGNVSIRSFQDGIYERSCSNCDIAETSLFSNGNGIYYQQSSLNTVEANNITMNSYAGIFLEMSQNNYISRNRLANNHVGAIRLQDFSSYNSIVGNDFADSTWYGVYIIWSCYFNRVFHNNFVNNTVQAYVDSSSSGNVWDDGYPSGGNYWNDYTGVDSFNGPGQNEIGSDGIGDTPYAVYASNMDNYPLMDAWNPTDASTVHLLLTVTPDQATYAQGQSVTLEVDVLNQLNPSLTSTLTLTISGPKGYYYFDFQSINGTADAVGEYSFTWSVPAVAGTYVVEVGLVPPRLTAYDAAWLQVV
jgi:parallel beta-helix repeat protein